MYTKEEALKLAKYYKDKVKGKPLDSEEAASLKIEKIDVDKAMGGGYNVHCYAKGSASIILHNRIQKVIKGLDLLSPDDALKEIAEKEKNNENPV